MTTLIVSKGALIWDEDAGEYVDMVPAFREAPPDVSWVEVECICCPGYSEHVSRWRKWRDKRRGVGQD